MRRAKVDSKRKPKPKAAPKLTLEQRLLLEQLKGQGYAALPEVKFHPERKWRVDVAVTRQLPVVVDATSEAIAVEIEGGAWSGGRHVRGKGYIEDMAKYNALTELGWRVLRFTPQQVLDGTALAQIVRCL